MTPQDRSRGEGRHPGAGIDARLAQVREGVKRVSPDQLPALWETGAIVIDTRTEAQRAEQGELPGAIVIDRTVLEWRLDPQSITCIPEVTDYQQVIVVVCRQGCSSSLAAASLRSVGLTNATDLVGGVEAWVAAGHPVDAGPADIRR